MAFNQLHYLTETVIVDFLTKTVIVNKVCFISSTTCFIFPVHVKKVEVNTERPSWSLFLFCTQDIYSERAEKIIAKHNASEPLFLYLPYQNVHEPLMVSLWELHL